MLVNESKSFRELCQENGIAVTHQRQVLYEVMKTMHGHPSPEEVYARVKKKVPAISLATVYKNIHLFVESGVFRKVSMHHGSVRVEMNDEPHHHMVCSKCKALPISVRKNWAWSRSVIACPADFWWSGMRSMSLVSVPIVRRLRSDC